MGTIRYGDTPSLVLLVLVRVYLVGFCNVMYWLPREGRNVPDAMECVADISSGIGCVKKVSQEGVFKCKYLLLDSFLPFCRP